MPRWTWLLSWLSVLGCAQVLDLGDYDNPGTGGAASTASVGGGSSGGGGSSDGGRGGSGGTADAPADWTARLDAVYYFDTASDIGREENDMYPLAVFGTPSLDSANAKQGSSSLLFEADDDYVGSAAAVFDSSPGQSLTFGGWFRITLGTGLVARKFATAGYGLRRFAPDGASCQFSAGNTPTAATLSGGWPPGVWLHFVCRYDNNRDTIAIVRNGAVTLAADMLSDVDVAAADFTVGPHSGTDVRGNVDELFFSTRALSDKAVRRLWACGISGERCRCDKANSEIYVECGEAKPACSGLPACDQLAPEL